MAKQGKERIIDAAFRLFFKQGYRGVSLKDIIESSQLSKGAIYHHFKSKHDIYLAAIETYFFEIITTQFPDDDHLSFRERLRRRYEPFIHIFDFIEKMEAGGVAYPIRTFFIFQLESEKDPSVRQHLVASMQQYRQDMTQLVQSAMNKGELDTRLSAQIIAEQLMSMIEGLAVHHSAVEKDCKSFLSHKFDEVIGSYLELLEPKKASFTH
ncbi:MAG: TetR/AcrR family transcriptional regulator [Bacteroidota bacterium]